MLLQILATQWGLPLSEIPQLGDRFYTFCERLRVLMYTKTRNTRAYGIEYVSGLLRMTTQRTITEISRQTGIASQIMQQFIGRPTRPPHFETKWTKRGKPAKKKPLVAQHCYLVRELLEHLELTWTQLTLRPTERGYLTADWSRCRVWLVEGERTYRRWLLIHRDPKQVTYCLSNAPVKISLETMTWRKSHRAFIERSNQDSKGDFGWDEFQALKYRAWQHQLALTILVAWFVAETRLDWQTRFAPDPTLLAQLETDVLPLLSASSLSERTLRIENYSSNRHFCSTNVGLYIDKSL